MNRVSRTSQPTESIGSLHMTNNLAGVAVKYAEGIGKVAVDLVDKRGYIVASVHLTAEAAADLVRDLADATAEASWDREAVAS